ncbi:glycosyltransferase family 87 protein [Micromonosporaceae bacterium Da 78-11]
MPSSLGAVMSALNRKAPWPARMGLVFLLARRWSGFAAAAGIPLAIAGATLAFLPDPGLFFTKTVPFLLHGQDNYSRPWDSSLSVMLPRFGIEGTWVSLIRGLVLLLTVVTAFLRWRRGGDQRLRIVETSATVMIGTFLVMTPTFTYYPMVILPALVGSAVVTGAISRSVWFWITLVPSLVGMRVIVFDFLVPEGQESTYLQVYKHILWILAVGVLLMVKVFWPGSSPAAQDETPTEDGASPTPDPGARPIGQRSPEPTFSS